MQRVVLFVLVILSFTVSANTASANTEIANSEEINGAFGVSLGEVFDMSRAIGKRSMVSGVRAIQFEPGKKFQFFSRYYVLLTSEAKQVYGIWAEGDMGDDETCKEAQTIVMNLLERKYGLIQKNTISAKRYAAKRISRADRYIETSCFGYNVALSIRYHDSALREKAEHRLLDNKIEVLNASGL